MRRPYWFVVLMALPLLGAAQEPADPHQAFEQFMQHLASAEAYLQQSPYYESDIEKAGAYQHLTRMLIKAIEQEMLQDPDYPFFRVMDFNIREGGDNADQRYLFAQIRGGESYRIWGDRGSADRVEIQLYSGEPWAGTGASVGFLGVEDIHFNDDGTFDVQLSKDAAGRNTLKNPEATTTVMVRQIYRRWTTENPGDIHIDRVGFEGKRKPPMGVEEVAKRLARVGQVAEQSIRVWPDFVGKRYVQARPANTLSPLRDTSRYGGVPGRWMAGGHFDIPEGYALVIKSWPTSARYQGIQLTDRWFASLEYANQVSSLTDAQTEVAEDGAFYYVISAEDPGYVNWLDTGSLQKGVILMRFDGVQGSIPEAKWPHAKRVKLDKLATVIPGFAKQQAADREGQIKARRAHIQTRFHR